MYLELSEVITKKRKERKKRKEKKEKGSNKTKEKPKRKGRKTGKTLSKVGGTRNPTILFKSVCQWVCVSSLLFSLLEAISASSLEIRLQDLGIDGTPIRGPIESPTPFRLASSLSSD